MLQDTINLRKKLRNEILHFISTKYTKKKFILSDYLLDNISNDKCDIIRKFNNALLHSELQTNLMDFLNNPDYWFIVVHGTNTLQKGIDICKHGHDISLRKNQQYGVGEYYTTSLDIANNYATNKGVIVISLMISPLYTTYTKDVKLNIEDEDLIFVINNDNDKSFYLPIGLMENNVFLPTTLS